MPSDLRNSKMTKAMGLIYLLFNIASALEVSCYVTVHTYNTFFMDLPGPYFCVPFIFAHHERC